jgi:hypothetical protein
VFATVLQQSDARRATEVLEAVLAHSLRCALTGGLAIDWQLGAHGRQVAPRPLNDIDLVVEGFASIPESLAGSFLLNHVHPCAAEGKTVLQLIDQTRMVRVDLFRAFGNTLSRAATLDETLVAGVPPRHCVLVDTFRRSVDPVRVSSAPGLPCRSSMNVDG